MPDKSEAGTNVQAKALGSTKSSRRHFAGSFLSAPAVVSTLSALSGQAANGMYAAGPLPEDTRERRRRAYEIRRDTALFERDQPIEQSVSNGDEQHYSKANYIANYSKGLPHNARGEVDSRAYRIYLDALRIGTGAAIEAVPKGGVLKLSDPQAAFSYSLDGLDPHVPFLQPAPAFDTAEQAADMVELYWLALTRDVPFAEHPNSPLIAQAVEELNKLSGYTGRTPDGEVTAETIFRGSTPGDLVGPYMSQLLCKTVPYGLTVAEQKYRTLVPGNDYMTSYSEWLNIQNGGVPSQAALFQNEARFLRTGRDLASWVYKDFSFQGFLNAALIVSGYGPAALSPSNPYKDYTFESGFLTFGAPHILDWVSRVAVSALKAGWYQKWLVHRRIRPEEFGGRVHHRLTNAAAYPIHTDLLNSVAAAMVREATGAYLLPQAFPEGCPAHPSYPAGHAVVSGACATVLKALFNESFVFPDPVEVSSDGTELLPYSGDSLSIGGELNKLAANITLSRDTAGLHYRSDGMRGLRLGEAVAISVIRDLASTLPEEFSDFTLTTFDGVPIRIARVV